MENIKTVGIKSLKNNLSAYLKEVRDGVRILITDHDQWIAELREPELTPDSRAAALMNTNDPSLQLFLSLSAEIRNALMAEFAKV